MLMRLAPSVSAPIRWTGALEDSQRLDAWVRAVRPVADWLVQDRQRADVLEGAWLGHAVHPPLTDLPIGMWSSALALDLVGGSSAEPAARRLIALGALAALPTVATGWAEFAGIGRREQRVAAVHAAANGVAEVLMVMSWRARRKGRTKRGKAYALLGVGSAGIGGYLGGHLIAARKVSSRSRVFAAH